MQALILVFAACSLHLLATAQDTGKLPAPGTQVPAPQTIRKKDTSPKKGIRVIKKDSAAKKRDSTAKQVTGLKRDSGNQQPAGAKKTQTPKQAPGAGRQNPVKDSSRRLNANATVSQHPADSGARTRPSVPHEVASHVPLSLPSFARDSIGGYRSFVRFLMGHNAIFNASDSVVSDITSLRNMEHAEETGLYSGIFYVIIGVLTLLGILRLTFSKYFSDLFRAFFNPTLSQRQLRDQLSQTPFPSLMLNIFFAISAGLYLFLVLLHYHYFVTERPLLLIPAFTGLLLLIYLFKYLFLRFAGWLFGYQDTAAGYAFTLYMVNKVLGIALLPFILILAFSPAKIADVALNLSLILIILLFVYRYIRIYGMARNQIFFQKFHFFIYLCGFEIAPILIVGKLVLIWLNGA